VTHLRQIMLEELERRNYAPSTIRAYIPRSSTLPALSLSTRPAWPEHIRQYQAAMFRVWKLAPNTVAAIGCVALPLHPGVEARLECRRDSLSEEDFFTFQRSSVSRR
jgi:hypothetical protein